MSVTGLSEWAFERVPSSAVPPPRVPPRRTFPVLSSAARPLDAPSPSPRRLAVSAPWPAGPPLGPCTPAASDAARGTAPGTTPGSGRGEQSRSAAPAPRVDRGRSPRPPYPTANTTRRRERVADAMMRVAAGERGWTSTVGRRSCRSRRSRRPRRGRRPRPPPPRPRAPLPTSFPPMHWSSARLTTCARARGSLVVVRSSWRAALGPRGRDSTGGGAPYHY